MNHPIHRLVSFFIIFTCDVLKVSRTLARAVATSFFQGAFGVRPCVLRHLLMDLCGLEGLTASFVTCCFSFLEAE